MEVELRKGQHATWAMSLAGEFFDCPNGFHSGSILVPFTRKGLFLDFFRFFWALPQEKRPRQGEERSGKTQGYSPAAAIWMDDGEVMEVYAFDPDQSLNTGVPEGWKDSWY